MGDVKEMFGLGGAEADLRAEGTSTVALRFSGKSCERQ